MTGASTTTATNEFSRTARAVLWVVADGLSIIAQLEQSQQDLVVGDARRVRVGLRS